MHFSSATWVADILYGCRPTKGLPEHLSDRTLDSDGRHPFAERIAGRNRSCYCGESPKSEIDQIAAGLRPAKGAGVYASTFAGKKEGRPSAERRIDEAGEGTGKGLSAGNWGRDPAVPYQS